MIMMAMDSERSVEKLIKAYNLMLMGVIDVKKNGIKKLTENEIIISKKGLILEKATQLSAKI